MTSQTSHLMTHQVKPAASAATPRTTTLQVPHHIQHALACSAVIVGSTTLTTSTKSWKMENYKRMQLEFLWTAVIVEYMNLFLIVLPLQSQNSHLLILQLWTPRKILNTNLEPIRTLLHRTLKSKATCHTNHHNLDHVCLPSERLKVSKVYVATVEQSVVSRK